jgi:hypothetical protein
MPQDNGNYIRLSLPLVGCLGSQLQHGAVLLDIQLEEGVQKNMLVYGGASTV